MNNDTLCRAPSKAKKAENTYYLDFNVKIWDSAVAETIQLALKQQLNIEAQKDHILPMPMLQVI